MPIDVTGMHRSGTSMIAKLLHLGGVYLGPEEELAAPARDNADGFWEDRRFVELNSEILRTFGGGWDSPPALPSRYDGERFEHLRRGAQTLLAERDGHEPWGWKDPRMCLTLPFWNALVDDLFTVVCVRNPIEVAVSLHRRNSLSYSLGIGLWDEYNRRVLAGTTSKNRVVTHYGAYFDDAAAEIRRLLAAVGRPAGDDVVERCVEATRAELRHTVFTSTDLLEANVSPVSLELYARLCGEAGWFDGARLSFPKPPRRRAGLFGRRRPEEAAKVNEDVVEVKVLREAHEFDLVTRGRLESHVAALDAQIVSLRAEIETLTEWGRTGADQVAVRDEQVVCLQALLDEVTQWAERASRDVRERDEQVIVLTAEVERLTTAVAAAAGEAAAREALQAEADRLSVELAAAADQAASRDAIVAALQADLQLATAEEAALRTELDQLRGELAQTQVQLEQLNAELAPTTAMRDRLAGEVDRLGLLIAQTREELEAAQLDANAPDPALEELEVLRAQLAASTQALAERDAQIAALRVEADALRDAASEQEQLSRRLAGHRADVVQLEERLAAAEAENVAASAQVAQRDESLRELQEYFEDTLAGRDEMISRFQQDVAEVSDHAHAMVRDVALRDGAIRQLQEELASAQAATETAEAKAGRQDERAAALAHELETLRAEAEATANEHGGQIQELAAELAETRLRLEAEGAELAGARGEAAARAGAALEHAARATELEDELAEARRAAGKSHTQRKRLAATHAKEIARRKARTRKLLRRLAAVTEQAKRAEKRAKQVTKRLGKRDREIERLERELAASRTRADEVVADAARHAAADLDAVNELKRALHEREVEGDDRTRQTARDVVQLRAELGHRDADLRALRDLAEASSAELRAMRAELDEGLRELRRARVDIETAAADAGRAHDDVERPVTEHDREPEVTALVDALREALAADAARRSHPAGASAPPAQPTPAPQTLESASAEREVRRGPIVPGAAATHRSKATAPQSNVVHPPLGPRPVPAKEAPGEYPALRRGVGAIARGVIPAGASVAVVSRGDDELLREIGPGAVHFPQGESGRYAGYHPGSGGVAINHLEELMRNGVQYLLFPATAYWWFDHYRSLRDYLDDRHDAVWGDAFCRIYDLRASKPELPPEAPVGNGVDILCYPIIDWSFRFQRPQQIATQFARSGHRVLYFKTRFHQQGPDAIVEQIAENVFEVQLPGPDHLNLYEHTLSDRERDRLMDALDRLRRRMRITDAVSFVDLPFWTPLALHSRERWGWRIVYDCMDDHSGFSTVRPEMLRSEDELVRESDLLLTTSQLLYEKMSPKASRTLLLPNAADFEHFSTPTEFKPLAHLPRPIVGYYGAISDWFDTEMVLKAALARRDWTFVLVGDTFGADVEGLRALENVHLLGEQPYKSLPSYLQSFDVATIPFLITPLTEATNPVKFYEYLSAGKPVVSVDLPELAPYRDFYYSARDASSFVRQVERALAENSSEAIADRREFGRRNSWGQRYELLGSSLRSAYGKAAIVILSFDNLAYLRLCLESIWQNTLYPNYEVIVVDNASSRPVVDYLLQAAEQEPRLRLILNDENLGFARANNQGLEAAGDAEYLFLLNDDTIVTYGWLGKLIRYLRDERIGLVGPVSNWAGNEAKIDVSYTDVGQMPAFAATHMREHSGESFDIDMLAMFCVGLRRDVLEKVGYLNERFGIGMFEDDDFSMRVRKAWYRVVCAEDVFIHHWGRASFSRLDEETYAKLFDENRKTFEQLWGQEWRPHQHR
jgi:GT2 family glycosyltransferase/glycosyltransferase involved in cell wall biosynthesis/chromosome segregation ATPase